ncbi:MAG: monovalent cation/H(+) antiporter subunit G [Elusimicrobia bacterium]|nr:monovalent cation/H(+) antiporter subunit G [Elusimicrobiota bacterium]
MAEIIILFGSVIVLIGCIGFIRFSDFYARVNVLTKSVPFGISIILFGVFVRFGFDEMGIRTLIAVILLWFIIPIIGYAISTAIKNAK